MGYFDDKPANIDDEGWQLIINAKNLIEKDKSFPNRDCLIEKAMNEMYDYFAKCKEKDLNCSDLQLKLLVLERMLSDEYIIESEPIFDENDEPVLPSRIYNEKDATQLLDYIVYQTRKYFSKYFDLRVDSLESQCIEVSKKIEEICSKFGVETIHIGINQKLKRGYFHHFTIVRITLEDGTHRKFLVDCTYRQFFTKTKSNLKRIGVVRIYSKGASIGAYMIKTKRRKEIANSLISRGYVEITPEVIKEYFDAIVFSGRDEEYYDKHGLDYMKDDDIVPEYTAKDYIKMILDMILEEEKTMSSIANEFIKDKDLYSNKTSKQIGI